MPEGKWHRYTGRWRGSYYMIGGKSFAHVTQHGAGVPEIYVRLPDACSVARWHPRMLPRTVEAAEAMAEQRLAMLHPALFPQRELEV